MATQEVLRQSLDEVKSPPPRFMQFMPDLGGLPVAHQREPQRIAQVK
jgi:hypothetical protein